MDGESKDAGYNTTPLSRAEEILRERNSQHFFREVLDSLSSHIVILDDQGVIFAVNAAWRNFARANGADLDRVCEGVNYLSTCDRAEGDCSVEAPIVAAAIRSVLRGDQETRCVEYPCHSLLQPRWFSVRIAKFNGAGPPSVVVAHDTITERKLAENALSDSEARYRAIFETSTEGILLTNPDGTVLAANPAACRIFDRSASEICAAGREGLVDVTDPRLQVLLSQRAATGQTRGEMTLIRKDGTPFTAELSSSTFRDQQGELRASIIIRDVSEHKRAEESLRLREGELAQISRLNTVGEMATALAHELNQPLYAIANYVGGMESLVEKLGPAVGAGQLADSLTYVSREVSRAASIVRRLREFVRGRGAQHSNVDLAETLRQATSLMEPLARSKGVPVRLRVGEGIPHLQADPVQIEQVVVNLVANAIDAVRDLPPPRRLVLVEACKTESRMVEITVHDKGRGVPAELRDSLFEAFVSTKQEGLGVGLTICRSLVHAHGGEIWIVHHAPHGTSVHFTLPLVG